MDTHSGRTAERTELRTAEPHPDGSGRTDLLPDEAADPFAEALAEALAEPSGLDTGPDGADDPGWDYEDVILRSVN
ncbi:hypothetical protein [Kitasatospora phosalacinea]|uniref:hypothetical protein n=1 Tax=Kitasatospora phosalacinea TaxID=2065 RepID=UPI0005260673|nr:hypothetical protein [Kitasatospora phosalacinea]